MIRIKSEESCHYYVEKVGKGKPLLFLPAAGFTGIEGKNIAYSLKAEFESHLLDLPGFGRADGIRNKCTTMEMARWVKQYLDQNNLDKVYLAGHSLGGALSLNFAVHFPERVHKLVLLDQGHKPFPRIPKSEMGLFAYTFPIFNMMEHLFGKRLLKRLEPIFQSDMEMNEDKLKQKNKSFCKMVGIKETDYIREAMMQQTSFSTEGLNLYMGYYRMNLPKLLQQIQVPTYLIYGTFEDHNEKEAKNTSKWMNKINKYELPIKYRPVKGGHYVHWSDDDQVLPDLKNFLLK